MLTVYGVPDALLSCIALRASFLSASIAAVFAPSTPFALLFFGGLG